MSEIKDNRAVAIEVLLDLAQNSDFERVRLEAAQELLRISQPPVVYHQPAQWPRLDR